MSLLGYTNNGLNQSLNGIVSITDGTGSTMSEGNINAINITGTNVIASNIFGTIETSTQSFITSLGTLVSLTVSGLTSLSTTNITGVLTMAPNQDIIMSGNGKFEQNTSTGTNLLSDVLFNPNSNMTQSGTGILSQSGGGTNALKATNITGAVGVAGNITQSSGSNTFGDSFINSITQSLSSIISQSGTGTNILKSTQINNLIVTTSLQIPANVTIPGATYTDNTVYTGTAVILQSGTGINTLKDSQITGNLQVSGNFDMIGGSATSTLKTPTITGITTLQSLVQTSGTSILRGVTCNEIDLNSGFDVVFAGLGKINQSLSTGINNLNSVLMNSGKDITFQGIGKIDQTSSSGANILQATQFNDNVTLNTDKLVKFANSTTNPRKMILWDTNTGTVFNQYGFNLESGIIRYNVGATTANHVFSTSNSTTATGYNELMRLNATGLGIGKTPTVKLDVLGNSYLDGNTTFTGNMNNCSAATFDYIKNLTSDCQTQINSNSSTGSGNASAITALQTKTTDLSYASGISTFANQLRSLAFQATTGLFSGLLTASAGISTTFGTFTGNITAATITLTNTINSTKLILYNGVNTFDFFGFGIESNTLRYNVVYNATHRFSTANASGASATAYTDALTISRSNSVLTVPLTCTNVTASGDVIAVNGAFSGTLTSAGHTSTSINTGAIVCTSINNSGASTLVGNVGMTNNLNVGGTSTLVGNVGMTNDLNVGGKLTVVNDAILQQITTIPFITYNNTIISSSFTKNSSGLGCTIVTSPHYVKTINVQIPIHMYNVANLGSGPFGASLNSISMVVNRNGVYYSTPTLTYVGSLTYILTANSYTSAAVGATAEACKTTVNFDIVCADIDIPATYTAQFTFSTISSQSSTLMFVNSLVTTTNLVNCTVVYTPNVASYKPPLYTDLVTRVIGSRTGQTEVSDFTVSGESIFAGDINLSGNLNLTNNLALPVNLYYPGMIGAYMVDGTFNNFHYHIAYSIPDYTNFYSKSVASSVVPAVGTVQTTTLNGNNFDDIYLVMPGFQIVVYDTVGYTTVTLNYSNTQTFPQYVKPTSPNTGSCCQLYFNGTLL